jgi:Flp pilus assembly protein TadB
MTFLMVLSIIAGPAFAAGLIWYMTRDRRQRAQRQLNEEFARELRLVSRMQFDAKSDDPGHYN